MLRVWRRRLIAGGGGMVVLSIVLVALVMVRFQYAPVEGHVLELMMWAFGAGYTLYSGVALPLLSNSLANPRARTVSEVDR